MTIVFPNEEALSPSDPHARKREGCKRPPARPSIRRDSSKPPRISVLTAPLKAERRNPVAKPFSETGIPIPSSGVWNTMKVALWPLFIWLMRSSSITTSATQPVVRQRTKPARPISAWSILRPRPGGQEHAQRRDDAQEAAFAVRRLQHDDHERDVRPVLGGHVLDDGALLGLGAGRRLAAHLPVAEGVLHDALARLAASAVDNVSQAQGRGRGHAHPS